MDDIKEIRRLIGRYGLQANIDTVMEYPSFLTQVMRQQLEDAISPIIADAQHYRSLQGKIDEQA